VAQINEKMKINRELANWMKLVPLITLNTLLPSFFNSVVRAHMLRSIYIWPITIKDKQILERLISSAFLRIAYMTSRYSENTIAREVADRYDKQFLNGLLISLQNNILEQLGNREHLLVLLTDGIVVIEPFSIQKNLIHGGVMKELLYLKNLNSTVSDDEKRKICAIFSFGSLEQIIKLQNFRRKYREKLRDLICESHSINTDVGDLLLDELLNDQAGISSLTNPLGNLIDGQQLSNIRTNMVSFKKRV
jgi:hypothetical protein